MGLCPVAGLTLAVGSSLVIGFSLVVVLSLVVGLPLVVGFSLVVGFCLVVGQSLVVGLLPVVGLYLMRLLLVTPSSHSLNPSEKLQPLSWILVSSKTKLSVFIAHLPKSQFRYPRCLLVYILKQFAAFKSQPSFIKPSDVYSLMFIHKPFRNWCSTNLMPPTRAQGSFSATPQLHTPFTKNLCFSIYQQIQ